MYSPKPIDTKDIKIPDDLNSLIELLAENVHEVWAKQRIEEGWKFGTEKNSELKTTPCLVPYNELPDEEKEYDRQTALETLKVLIKMGFTMKK